MIAPLYEIATLIFFIHNNARGYVPFFQEFRKILKFILQIFKYNFRKRTINNNLLHLSYIKKKKQKIISKNEYFRYRFKYFRLKIIPCFYEILSNVLSQIKQMRQVLILYAKSASLCKKRGTQRFYATFAK